MSIVTGKNKNCCQFATLLPLLRYILEKMKLQLKHSDKQVLAEKSMDLANLTFGGLTLAQTFSESKSLIFAILGALALIFGYYLAMMTLNGRD